MRRRNRIQVGFTLIELLVGIGIESGGNQNV